MQKINLILLLCVFITNCGNEKSLSEFKLVNNEIQKIGGITFDGPAHPPINKKMLNSIENTGVSWVSTCPEAFTYHNTLNVQSFYDKEQWYGQTIHGSIIVITIAKEKGYKVMMKPHIDFSYDISNWNSPERLNLTEKYNTINSIIRNIEELDTINDPKEFLKKTRNHKDLKQHYIDVDNHYKGQKKYISSQRKLTLGKWRGDFDVVDSLKWKVWENEYERYILNCAKLSDSLNVDLFCIGTELSISATKREKFWRQLIKKVKKVYHGPLTYSANWDNYHEIKFWDQLDFIGISAYFPLSDKENPTLNDLMNEWKIYYTNLEKISKQYYKPILFTEYGYKSIKFAAKEPWKEYLKNDPSEISQFNLYNALYKTFWDKNWFAGGFIWKWYYNGNGGKKSFSPQQKITEKLMTKWYSKSSNYKLYKKNQ